jgi:hypothetical protein
VNCRIRERSNGLSSMAPTICPDNMTIQRCPRRSDELHYNVQSCPSTFGSGGRCSRQQPISTNVYMSPSMPSTDHRTRSMPSWISALNSSVEKDVSRSWRLDLCSTYVALSPPSESSNLYTCHQYRIHSQRSIAQPWIV